MENKKKKYAKEIEQIRRESGAKPELCMVCGKCSGSCPAFDEMDVHPHQFAQMILRGELDELMNSRGIYKCMSCFTCSERCPRGVEPAKLVEAIRLMVIRKQGENAAMGARANTVHGFAHGLNGGSAGGTTGTRLFARLAHADAAVGFNDELHAGAAFLESEKVTNFLGDRDLPLDGKTMRHMLLLHADKC